MRTLLPAPLLVLGCLLLSIALQVDAQGTQADY
jgi:hypothetical protein